MTSSDWWVMGTLLGVLTASAWPPWRQAILGREEPCINGPAGAGCDERAEAYAFTGIYAGRSATVTMIASWDQITMYAAKRSTEMDILYVCVSQGIQRWYWQYGYMTDAPAITSEARERELSTRSQPQLARSALTDDAAVSWWPAIRGFQGTGDATVSSGPRHRRQRETRRRWWTVLRQFAVGAVSESPADR
ncbi:hypothetical protein [Microtetraspora malaysiensis]|uniref:hypothetical protein n=1 Tax=Microtetraspora malaysiensis TaxID=161358 RepID=UPI003D8D154E